jgi:hypothetical protein
MRMMLHAVIDTEAGNQALRDGSLRKVIDEVVDRLEPEAIYFAPSDGQRSLVAVFDMTDPSQLPAINEPLFVGAKARLSISPCMNLDDLRRGLAQVTSQASLAGA